LPRHLAVRAKAAVVRRRVADCKSRSVMAARRLITFTLALAVLQAACDGWSPRGGSPVAGTVTLVNRVRAEVRCTTTCESKLEAALRSRLEPAVITISADAKTVDLKFERTASVFSSASFRQAVAEAGGQVTTLGIEACGTVSQSGGDSWIRSGSTRLLLDGSGPFITDTEICVTGELRDQESPPKLRPRRLSE
jgi:hypothetical protein